MIEKIEKLGKEIEKLGNPLAYSLTTDRNKGMYLGFEDCRNKILALLRSKRKEVNMNRPDWNDYFINIACEVAQRATCPRAKVGAVIVKDHRIISTGYNGAPAGEPHCYDEGCLIENDHCYRAVHAEVNAVAEAAKFGLAVDGAILYYWDSQERPESCHNCIQVMKAAGLIGVIDRFQTYMSLRSNTGTTSAHGSGNHTMR